MKSFTSYHHLIDGPSLDNSLSHLISRQQSFNRKAVANHSRRLDERPSSYLLTSVSMSFVHVALTSAFLATRSLLETRADDKSFWDQYKIMIIAGGVMVPMQIVGGIW